MSKLMRLQKSRVITIQRCDKGGGLIIRDTPEYIRAGEKHLTSSMRKGDGTEVNFYKLKWIMMTLRLPRKRSLQF